MLVAIDTYTDWLKPVRNFLEEVTYPLHQLADLPSRVADWGDDVTRSRVDLEQENEKLRTEILVYQALEQRMAELAAENIRLRGLLNATELVKDRVRVAELVSVSPDPLSHKVTINRGAEDGVFVGQAVIGSLGLMGQVTDVYRHHSRVLLITDSSHALPVQVSRNGLRSIAEGIGDYGELKLRYVSPTMDIREGDTVISSGLGDRYPVGYPVGKVVSVEEQPGEPFLNVTIEPAEPLNRRRHVLLVFSDQEAKVPVPNVEEQP
ncbi:rod shape-determining protein MreC [Porticoccaceae bacterium LTM1]|nr:rod shape-determining protein MreC [Porticoccaceae bacterium LTM1]